jgi:HPt (histidine-containing phosphotransfer) domain-containing protein
MSQLLNMDTISVLRDLGDDLVLDLIQTYIEESDRLVSEMESAALSGDTARIGSIAHSMKGSSLNMGLEIIGEVSLRLEKMGKGGDLDGARGLIPELQQSYIEAKQALLDLEKQLIV